MLHGGSPVHQQLDNLGWSTRVCVAAVGLVTADSMVQRCLATSVAVVDIGSGVQ